MSESTVPGGRVVLVTGAMGCIGSWVVKQALEGGHRVVALDAQDADHRLRLALGSDTDTSGLVRVLGDITDSAFVVETMNDHGVDAVVHLAALQVPAVAARPVLGAQVNVVGMAVVLDAMVQCGVTSPLAYASSVAAYEQNDPGDEADGALGGWPATLYGVYKRANEGAAHVYWEASGVASIGLRPYVVYGPGRDFGMTADPTFAMEAVARGEGFHIRFGGVSQLQYVEDVAAAFLAAATGDFRGAVVTNIGGEGVRISDVIDAIEAAVPSARGTVTFDDVQLPFPPVVRSSANDYLELPAPTPLAEGVHRTIARFREAGRS